MIYCQAEKEPVSNIMNIPLIIVKLEQVEIRFEDMLADLAKSTSCLGRRMQRIFTRETIGFQALKSTIGA